MDGWQIGGAADESRPCSLPEAGPHAAGTSPKAGHGAHSCGGDYRYTLSGTPEWRIARLASRAF